VDSEYCEGTRGFKTPLNNVNNVRLCVARDEMVKDVVVRGFEWREHRDRRNVLVQDSV
jgi:hypothetical protein